MLNDADRAQAAEQGWELQHVYDLTKRKLVLTVMPVHFPAVSAWAARDELIRRAKRGEQLALRALKIIHRSNV